MVGSLHLSSEVIYRPRTAWRHKIQEMWSTIPALARNTTSERHGFVKVKLTIKLKAELVKIEN